MEFRSYSQDVNEKGIEYLIAFFESSFERNDP
jgi:hypothetical protein